MNHDQQKYDESTPTTGAAASCLKSTGKSAKKRRCGVMSSDEEDETDNADEEDDYGTGGGRPPAPQVLGCVLGFVSIHWLGVPCVLDDIANTMMSHVKREEVRVKIGDHR
jgi:hypothetical protein